MTSVPTGGVSHAEEDPKNNGNPPIEAKILLEGESSSEMPPVRPPPRLRTKGRQFVQLFVAKEYRRMVLDGASERDLLPPVRSLLVNRAFLDAFFDAEPFGPVLIFFVRGHTAVAKARHRSVLFALTDAGITSLLRLCREATEIDVHWSNSPTDGNFARVHDWMRIASRLRALPNLTAIRLSTGHLQHAGATFLVDSLPDRLRCVKTNDLRVASMLRKRQDPLESLEFFIRGGQHPYIADILRSKSARITLRWRPQGVSSGPHQLHDCGPVPRNEHLQELRIPAEILVKCGTPQTFRSLRAINDHFKLICYGAYRLHLDEPMKLKHVERIAKRAKKFAAEMRNAGFRSGGDELRISLNDAENWQHVSHEQAFERLNWTREGEISWAECSKSLPTCSLVYKGVRILIGLDRV